MKIRQRIRTASKNLTTRVAERLSKLEPLPGAAIGRLGHVFIPDVLTATRQRSLADVAATSLARIEQLLRTNSPLTHADENWLSQLQSAFGRGPVEMNHPEKLDETIQLETGFDAAFINEDPQTRLEAIADTLKAMTAATAYRPITKAMGNYEVSAHNSEIARALQSDYTPESFAALFKLCDDHEVFRIAIDDATGIGKTTEISDSEDDIMNQMWVTDAVRFGRIQNSRYPEKRQQALGTLAEFYKNEAASFAEAIANPAGYRDPDSNVGVHHLFYPESREAFPWLAPKRLESHGLALGEFCDAIVAGQNGEAWGFPKAGEPVLEAIGNLVKFFEAIDYETAPANGVWEELNFAESLAKSFPDSDDDFGGLTWDVEAIRAGLEKFANLMFNPAFNQNPEIARVRKTLAASPFGALLTDKKAIEKLIANGQRKVEDRVLREIPTENPSRNADSSLAFVTSSSIRLSPNVNEDIRAHLHILDYLEKTLVQANGLVKYAPFKIEASDKKMHDTFDSYLVPNWGLASDVDGNLTLHRFKFEERFEFPLSHVEPSNPDRFVIRSRYAGIKDKPSEWSFTLSEMARGYGVQLKKLLDAVEASGRSPTAEQRALLQTLRAKSTEYINRSFSQVTGGGDDGRPMVKSNGKACRTWAVPEAFQHVSTFEVGEDGKRRTQMLPGVNTPLGWSTATLFSAAELFAENLKRMEAFEAAT